MKVIEIIGKSYYKYVMIFVNGSVYKVKSLSDVRALEMWYNLHRK